MIAPSHVSFSTTGWHWRLSSERDWSKWWSPTFKIGEAELELLVNGVLQELAVLQEKSLLITFMQDAVVLHPECVAQFP